MEYGIFVGILIIHGFITSVAVRWNGVMNQLACKYLPIFFIVNNNNQSNLNCIYSLVQYAWYFTHCHRRFGSYT
jgi:hypothetical protein